AAARARLPEEGLLRRYCRLRPEGVPRQGDVHRAAPVCPGRRVPIRQRHAGDRPRPLHREARRPRAAACVEGEVVPPSPLPRRGEGSKNPEGDSPMRYPTLLALAALGFPLLAWAGEQPTKDDYADLSKQLHKM